MEDIRISMALKNKEFVHKHDTLLSRLLDLTNDLLHASNTASQNTDYDSEANNVFEMLFNITSSLSSGPCRRIPKTLTSM